MVRGPEQASGNRPEQQKPKVEKITTLPYTREYELPGGVMASITFTKPRTGLPSIEYKIVPPFIPNPEQQRKINRLKSTTTKLIGRQVGLGEMSFAQLQEGTSSLGEEVILGESARDLNEEFWIRTQEAIDKNVPIRIVRNSIKDASRLIPGKGHEGAKMGERHDEVKLATDKLINDLEAMYDEDGNIKPKEPQL